MGTIRVNQNVYQAARSAANDTTLGGLLKPDISSAEMSRIETAIGADGRVDAEEQKLLDALKNHASFTLTNGRESTPFEPGSVSFPAPATVNAAETRLGTIVRFGDGYQASLGQAENTIYATPAEAIQGARLRQSYAPVDAQDYAVVQRDGGYGLRRLETRNGLHDLAGSEVQGARVSGTAGGAVKALVADSGEVRHFDALPHWTPAAEIRTVADVQRRLNAMLPVLRDRGDHRAVFPAVYIAATNKGAHVIDAIRNPNHPEHAKYKDLDPRLVEDIIVEFGKKYFQAFDNYEAGNLAAVPPAWRETFDEARNETTTGVEDMLMGINAHIGNDLAENLAQPRPGGGTLYDPTDPRQVRTFDAFNQLLIDETPTILRNVAAVEDKLGGVSVRGMDLAGRVGNHTIGASRVEAITRAAFTAARRDAEHHAVELMHGRTTEAAVEREIGQRARIIANSLPNSGRQYIP